jgi:hypothetical protein
MKTQKMNLANIQGKMKREEMKQIKGGLRCEPRGFGGCSAPPAGNCSVNGGPGRCCWAYC